MGEPAMVQESARPHLKALSKLAADLNQASDRYTEELKAIEAELNSLNLGLELTLSGPISESDLQVNEWEDYGELRSLTFYDCWYLAYGKHRGDWHLLVRKYRVTTDDSGKNTISEKAIETLLLLQASRDLRMASAGRILDLLAALQEEAKEKIAALKKVSDARKA